MPKDQSLRNMKLKKLQDISKMKLTDADIQQSTKQVYRKQAQSYSRKFKTSFSAAPHPGRGRAAPRFSTEQARKPRIISETEEG